MKKINKTMMLSLCVLTETLAKLGILEMKGWAGAKTRDLENRLLPGRVSVS